MRGGGVRKTHKTREKKLKQQPLPINTFPVSIDVVGLYSNIPHEEALSYGLLPTSRHRDHQFICLPKKGVIFAGRGGLVL